MSLYRSSCTATRRADRLQRRALGAQVMLANESLRRMRAFCRRRRQRRPPKAERLVRELRMLMAGVAALHREALARRPSPRPACGRDAAMHRAGAGRCTDGGKHRPNRTTSVAARPALV